jgi:hypothetical protein
MIHPATTVTPTTTWVMPRGAAAARCVDGGSNACSWRACCSSTNRAPWKRLVNRVGGVVGVSAVSRNLAILPRVLLQRHDAVEENPAIGTLRVEGLQATI